LAHAHPYESLADPVLMVRVGEGDAGAYRELVQRHGTRLQHYARRLLGDGDEAEDVVQETFLRLWQRPSAYSPEARLTTWLHRIAHNLAVDRLRARGRWQALDDEEQVPISASQLRHIAEQERKQSLDAALGRLPERQRAALVLVHLHELSGKEAAAVLDIGEEALESLLSRGRRALRQMLQGETQASWAAKS
jgi:RNA polymerase sigma-70 factor (ECF subfamily)